MKKIGLRRLIIILLVLFSSLISADCFALEVGNESAQINVNGWDAGLYYIVTDPQGRRAGYDFETKKYVEEFPASLGISLDIRADWNDLFVGEGMMNLIPGTYTIEVLGVALTKYSVNISISRRLPDGGPTGIDLKTLNVTPEQIAAIKAMSTAFNYEGVIDKGRTSKYQFTYTSDPTKPAAVATRIVEPGNLKQDIELLRKLKDLWTADNGEIIRDASGEMRIDSQIDNDGIMNSLLKKAEAIEASIARGNRKAAENQLNAFINEVEAQKDKHISSKAVKILLEDAQYLVDNLK